MALQCVGASPHAPGFTLRGLCPLPLCWQMGADNTTAGHDGGWQQHERTPAPPVFLSPCPFSPNPLALISIDTQLFGGVVFPKSPPNDIMVKYPRETPKTLNKSINNNEIRFLHRENNYSMG